MKPLRHARNSAKKYGGRPDEYLFLHDWMDSSKAHLADMRHRAILHSSFGIFIAEQVFGTSFKNSAGRSVMIRDLAEDHVLEDLGTIPTVADWLREMPVGEWMGGPVRKQRFLKFSDIEDEEEN